MAIEIKEYDGFKPKKSTTTQIKKTESKKDKPKK